MTPEEWLGALEAKKSRADLDEVRIRGARKVIEGKTQGSDRYCAWVSSTRKAIERELFSIFGDVECSSGGRTKFNREKLGFPKAHHYDAACVGSVPGEGFRDLTNGYYLLAEAVGRGSRMRGNTNSCGVIITKYRDGTKRVISL